MKERDSTWWRCGTIRTDQMHRDSSADVSIRESKLSSSNAFAERLMYACILSGSSRKREADFCAQGNNAPSSGKMRYKDLKAYLLRLPLCIVQLKVLTGEENLRDNLRGQVLNDSCILQPGFAHCTAPVAATKGPDLVPHDHPPPVEK